MSARFDRIRIDEFVALAARTLDGEWLLIGGGAAAVWFAPSRTTEDIDIVGLRGTQDDRFALMELAATAGIPIEAVNSAADFFVRRIPDWRDELVVLTAGRATIYRPTATLFLLLKIGRLSATDLDDCMKLIVHVASTGEPLDRVRVGSTLAALAPTDDVALAARRVELANALELAHDA
ncbi:MAG: hypothetical protein ACKV2T_40730 [Kofleriaceae bacterium]